jgi:hypothetical protein
MAMARPAIEPADWSVFRFGHVRCVAAAKGEQEHEWNPYAAGKFCESCAFVGGEESVAREERHAAGQRFSALVERLACQCSCGEPGSGKQKKGERNGNPGPRQKCAERSAHHPRERRIEDKPRLARAVIGAGRPVRIRDSVPPGIESIEPGNQMEVEVVAAGVAVDEFGGDGYEGGEEDDGWADEAVPTWFIPRSQKRDRGHPVVLLRRLHGSSRSVCFVCAATAAGLKANGNVVPPYQSFHWSRNQGLSGSPLSPSTMFCVEPSTSLQSMVKR